jgi:hypothetical protein
MRPMSFDWLNKFHKEMDKPADYAEKTLAAYKLGMRAKGSIAGVQVLIDPEGCQACRQLDPELIYHPDEAPRIPLTDCDRSRLCQCVYRPVMSYQIEE